MRESFPSRHKTPESHARSSPESGMSVEIPPHFASLQKKLEASMGEEIFSVAYTDGGMVCHAEDSENFSTLLLTIKSALRAENEKNKNNPHLIARLGNGLSVTISDSAQVH